MAQYIKKVGTTPVRGNGFIVDSFNTNDNKQFNAPSLNAVMERTDNNLLLCGTFVNFRSAGAKVNGWQVSAQTGYVGAPGMFQPVAGLWLPAGYEGLVRTPYLCALDTSDFDMTSPYSLSVMFNTNGGMTGAQTGKAENIVQSSVTPILDITFDSKLRVIMSTFYGGGKLMLYVYNLTDSDLFIKAIKFEKGATCTPIEMIGKDYGISGAVEDSISNKFATIEGEFITNANGEASVNLNYPSGFSKSNSVVMAVGISDSNGRFHYHKISSDKTCTREYVILDDGYVNIYYQGTSADANSTLEYRVTLYKF